MKKYVAPKMFVDVFVADTMIASVTPANPKNGNGGNNQNCWGCDTSAGGTASGNSENACNYVPNTPAYDYFCT